MRTNSKVPQIIELIKQGCTAREVMNQVGCTRMNVHSVAKRYNLQLTLADRKKYSQEDIKTFNELKLNGLTNKEISQRFNCPEDVVKRINRGLGQVFRNQYSIDSFDSENHARIMINNYLRDRNIEYAGNYKGSEQDVDLRCKNCGTVFTRCCISVRGKKIRCPECAEKRRQENAKKREQDTIIKIEQKLKQQERDRLLREAEKQKRIEAKKHPCIVCGQITIRPKFCSEECRHKVVWKNKEIRRKRNIENAIVDKDISLEKLYKRDQGICYICGLQCNYEDYVIRGDIFIAGDYYPSIEHIKPLSKGGLHSWNNVKLAHRRCNTFKGVNEVVV